MFGGITITVILLLWDFGPHGISAIVYMLTVLGFPVILDGQFATNI
jgi:hypothetical protein